MNLLNYIFRVYSVDSVDSDGQYTQPIKTKNFKGSFEYTLLLRFIGSIEYTESQVDPLNLPNPLNIIDFQGHYDSVHSMDPLNIIESQCPCDSVDSMDPLNIIEYH